MVREILINADVQEKRVAIIENNVLEDFYVERQDNQKVVGNIYKGVVETIVPAIGAAFVQLGLGKNGFLYVQDMSRPDYEKMAEIIDERPETDEAPKAEQPATEIKDLFKPGQEVLVQVIKEPLGKKGPRLTTQISLPGRYLVFMPYDKHQGISRKIPDAQERNRLKTLLKELNVPDNIGLIIRTAGEGGTRKEFFQDLHYLTNLWKRIRITVRKKTAPALIHEEQDLTLRTIRDNFTNQTHKVIVDSKEEYKKIMHFLSAFAPQFKNRVQLYLGDIPLFERTQIEEAIAKIYERKVILNSGGYLVIEPTESLIAIDVNSGKFTGKLDPEQTAYQINLEAAKEIARQLRLRDLGGIIIIDFIDMKEPKHREKVFNVLNEALKRDRAKTDISAVSALGLIEMSRQRTRRSIESVAYQPCTYCKGKGLVKSPATMAILILRKLRKILQKIDKKTVLVFTHPAVASYLVNENRQAIFTLENAFKGKIVIRQDEHLHIEEFRIETI